MAVLLVTTTHYRPFFQALVAPAKIIYATFLRVIGSLLLYLGAISWGKRLQVQGEKINSQCTCLLEGLWVYGRKFLVHADNYEGSCRGSCFWLIDQHLRQPKKPLTELVKRFENGAPTDAIWLHQNELIPNGLKEKREWSYQFKKPGKMPKIGPGVYTFVISFSSEGQSKAHRIALFKQKNALLLILTWD